MLSLFKKGFLVFSLLGLVLVASNAQAEVVRSIGDNTFVVDNTFQIKKPSNAWDTMEINEFRSPAKWVKHVVGPNPVIRYRWMPNPAGPGADQFARSVESKLRGRGVQIESSSNYSVNGKRVVLINGIQGKERFLVATWRTPRKGYVLECTVDSNHFKKFRKDFMKAIDSVQIYNR